MNGTNSAAIVAAGAASDWTDLARLASYAHKIPAAGKTRSLHPTASVPSTATTHVRPRPGRIQSVAAPAPSSSTPASEHGWTSADLAANHGLITTAHAARPNPNARRGDCAAAPSASTESAP